jgi:UDP-glucose 4-epimerase
MNGPRCLVTGATGAVGPALVRRIAREGASIVGVARHAPPPDLLPGSVRVATHDVADAEVAAFARDADIVFHLAAKLHVNNPGADLRGEYERTNIDATRRLVDATPPSARFIFFGTIDVYGPTPAGTTATEDTPPRTRSLYGETKLAAEPFVLAHPGGTVLRLAAVYGPRVKANYARLARAIARGRYVAVGPGTNRRTVVFEEDVAEAAWRVATARALPSRVYNLTDGHPHTVDEIVRAIAAALGKRPPRLRLPAPLVKAGAWMGDRGARVVGLRFPVTPAMVDKLQEHIAVSGERLMRELPFEPGWPLDRGWRDAIAAMTGADNIS